MCDRGYDSSERFIEPKTKLQELKNYYNKQIQKGLLDVNITSLTGITISVKKNIFNIFKNGNSEKVVEEFSNELLIWNKYLDNKNNKPSFEVQF